MDMKICFQITSIIIIKIVEWFLTLKIDCAVLQKRYLISEAYLRQAGIPQCSLPTLTSGISGNACMLYYYMGVEKFAVLMKISAFWPLL